MEELLDMPVGTPAEKGTGDMQEVLAKLDTIIELLEKKHKGKDSDKASDEKPSFFKDRKPKKDEDEDEKDNPFKSKEKEKDDEEDEDE